ncbi:MAG TPA: Omp28-related outer membrane protein [Ignavibacteriaceae bacterium]
MKRKLRSFIILVSMVISVIAYSQDLFAQTQRNPVLEECTGTWCQWCPCGHTIMSQIQATMPNAILIGYHGPVGSSDPWDDFPGNQILSLLGFSGYPTAVIDRTGAPLSRSAWSSTMNQRYNVPATVSITMDKTFNKITRELSADISVTALENLTGEYKLSFLLLEDGLIYSQTGNSSCTGGSNYVHNHVVRAMINGSNGEELNGVNQWNQGETITKNIQYTVPSAIIPDSCELVAFVYKVISPLYNGTIQQGEKWDLVSPDYVATMVSRSPDIIVSNSSTAEFSATLYNQGLLSDTYNITATLDGPAGWMGEFTTENGTFTFGELDSVQVTVGDSTSISVTVNPNSFNGAGVITLECASKNDPGVIVNATFNVVTNTGVHLLVVDATEERHSSVVTDVLDGFYEGRYGVVSRAALLSPGIDLSYFTMIAWSGGNSNPAFYPEEVANLQTYLDQGGNLLLQGQNVGEDIFGPSGQSQFAQSFFNNYLHSNYINISGSFFLTGIAGDPLTGDITGFPLNAVYTQSPDIISPYDANTTPILQFGTGPNINSVKADNGIHKVVYFGIGFEQINDNTNWGIVDSLVTRSVRWLTDGIVLDNPSDETMITSFNLEQNYPNPFNPETIIEFQVLNTAPVSIKIYDLIGRELAVLVNEVKQPGVYQVSFDGKNLASGVYFYKMIAGDFTSVKKMNLLK